ncbi:MAG: glycoside hydrolase family 32 protein [Candidatus Azotimanducaceae bacterium]|uniref:beta-fructofuranosidase n=1 Tax=OM182 bacterium TaxID=2510334 RepID=A0A520S267_9GAMM|nr:hypothetical protein [Gammaproteobacteria bacterium]OUV67750.1 MAG: hypothetical protein CBC93_04265 [Gammaproteobacteria bacterium TMED133]RZO76568.1 MAG: hypothetical protein EVA68_03915 [OM182 bacterium]
MSSDPLVLNIHLMHPGGPSAPGDPNVAFYIDGVYHLHYILKHDWHENASFSFIHITSTDMLHWVWQETKLQPSFTDHGMFSGTGFITKEGCPAAIYHGQASGSNQIVLAKDNQLSSWHKPYPIDIRGVDDKEINIKHWDPDCFLIGDVYYAITGGQNPGLIKSNDLKDWIYVGDFLKHDLPDVVIGEDISCANFFPIENRWMLLCISHPFGCRYYIGDWDAETEQFVPDLHGRMNWRREGQSIEEPLYRDFFAPESLKTSDERRVMWAWCATLDSALDYKSLQSLPRELSLGDDGSLIIQPLRELELLRDNLVEFDDIRVEPAPRMNGGNAVTLITDLTKDAYEIRITIERAQVERKRFGFRLFSGRDNQGLSIIIKPETGTLRVGSSEAPFSVENLPIGENIELCIFVDKYLVEVFINGRQAMIAAHMDWQRSKGFYAYSFGAPTIIKHVDIWKLKSTNQGYLDAEINRVWEIDK